MKKTVLALLLIILMPAITAYQTQDVLNTKEIMTKIDISSSLDLVKKGPMYKIELMRAELHNFPRHDINQEVLSMTTIPTAENKGDLLRFEWRSPKDTTLYYQLTSTVKTQNAHNPIKEKITYPVRKQLDRGYEIFLKPTLNIDSMDSEIREKAKEITKGEDDLYIIVGKTANWVNKQVNYNLSTKTEKATQKASWVMKNKQGVCDEITALFIALLRAADIPARFVSGISYNYMPDKGETWGPHGWAEVYYPERGWVPYDITIGQYGRIDAGHIKLKEALDPRDKPTRVEWRGRDAGIEAQDLKIEAKIQETKGLLEPTTFLTIYPVKKRIGFDSYDLIIAEITNLKDFYITEELSIETEEELEVIGSKTKIAILKPQEKQKIYWRIKTKEALNHEQTYITPAKINTIWRETARTHIQIKQDNPSYTLDEIVKIQDLAEAGKPMPTEPEEKQEKIIHASPEPKKTDVKKDEIIQKFINWLKSVFR